jgi:hypothetical protein
MVFIRRTDLQKNKIVMTQVVNVHPQKGVFSNQNLSFGLQPSFACFYGHIHCFRQQINPLATLTVAKAQMLVATQQVFNKTAQPNAIKCATNLVNNRQTKNLPITAVWQNGGFSAKLNIRFSNKH